MAEKLPQGRGGAVRSTTDVEIGLHRRVEPDQAGFDQEHDCCDRGKRFGERSQVEHGIKRHRSQARDERRCPNRLLIDECALVANHENRAWETLYLDRLA
jgi:hypothetical protein